MRARSAASRAVLARFCAGGCWPAAHQARAQQQPPPQRFTLKEAVTRALQKSRELALARLQYETSRQEAGLTRAQFPSESVRGFRRGLHQRISRCLAGGGAPALFSLSYNQELFNLPARGDVHVAEQTCRAAAAGDGRACATASSCARPPRIWNWPRFGASSILCAASAKARRRYSTTRGSGCRRVTNCPIEVDQGAVDRGARRAADCAQLEDQEDTAADQLRAQLGLGTRPADRGRGRGYSRRGRSDRQRSGAAGAAKQHRNEAGRIATHGQRGPLERRARRILADASPLIGQYNMLGKFNNYDQFFNKFQRNNFIAGVRRARFPFLRRAPRAAVAFAQANLTASQMAVENKRAQVSLDVRHKARAGAGNGYRAGKWPGWNWNWRSRICRVLQSQFQQGRASVRDMEGGATRRERQVAGVSGRRFRPPAGPAGPAAQPRARWPSCSSRTCGRFLRCGEAFRVE